MKKSRQEQMIEKIVDYTLYVQSIPEDDLDWITLSDWYDTVVPLFRCKQAIKGRYRYIRRCVNNAFRRLNRNNNEVSYETIRLAVIKERVYSLIVVISLIGAPQLNYIQFVSFLKLLKLIPASYLDKFDEIE